MTDEELKAIERRTNAATPGPWYARCGPAWAVVESSKDVPEFMIGCFVGGREGDDGNHNDMQRANVDVRFVAHARDDVPTLLAEVRRLRAELESAATRREIDELKDAMEV